MQDFLDPASTNATLIISELKIFWLRLILIRVPDFKDPATGKLTVCVAPAHTASSILTALCFREQHLNENPTGKKDYSQIGPNETCFYMNFPLPETETTALKTKR